MKKITIFGNSGSGKSTLANQLSAKYNLAHLDLDTLAWDKQNPTIRRSIAESKKDIGRFIKENDNWIIEGCYTDLLNLVVDKSDHLIFLNPGEDICIANCIKRPWEPHKYNSLEEQNNNLKMLIDWIKQYSVKSDEFSLKAHRKLFDNFKKNKTEYTSNQINLL
jgi:adenylate kinase family enzyme